MLFIKTKINIILFSTQQLITSTKYFITSNILWANNYIRQLDWDKPSSGIIFHVPGNCWFTCENPIDNTFNCWVPFHLASSALYFTGKKCNLRTGPHFGPSILILAQVFNLWLNWKDVFIKTVGTFTNIVLWPEW